MRTVIATPTGAKLDSKAAAPIPGVDAVIRPTRVLITTLDRLWATSPASPATGAALGHVFVGVLESLGSATGPAAERAARFLNKRVAVNPVITCGQCDLCRSGLAAHCRARQLLGLSSRPGGLSERALVPASNLLPIPDGLDDDHAVFAVLCASAAHAAAGFRIESKTFVSVLGDGPIGLLTAQALARLNASVRLLGKHPRKTEMCARWGIKHRLISEVGRREDQDVVIDCTGDPAGLVDALGLVRPRGKVILKSIGASLPAENAAPGLGVHPLPPGAARELWERVVRDELLILGSGSGSLAEGLALLASGSVNVDGLITRRARLDDAPAFINTPADGEIVSLIEVR
ncbi:alcohol dehydrogenase catalytic domain-containing protein [soil metagenome]